MTRSLILRSLLSLWGSLALLSACNSGDDNVSEYRDNLGRVCSVANNAQLVPATCNKQPAPRAGCSFGTACFVVISSPLDTGQMQNCDTCCDETNKPGVPSYIDCGNVTCDRDEDCIYANGRCVQNYCYFGSRSPGTGGTSGGVTAGSPGQAGTAGTGLVAGGTAPTALGGAGTGGAPAPGGVGGGGTTGFGPGGVGGGGTTGFGPGGAFSAGGSLVSGGSAGR